MLTASGHVAGQVGGRAGLGGAPSGDISARFGDLLLITPSGAGYTSLRPAMIARMPLVGEFGSWKGPLKPSGEWRIHLYIARARPDIGAIVRFQSPYATALAMAHRDLAAHSMIALFGGPVVRCAKYAPAGTTELAGLTLEALGESHAVFARQLLRAGHRRNPRGRGLPGLGSSKRSRGSLRSPIQPAGRPLADDEVARIAERLKANGADSNARTATADQSKIESQDQGECAPQEKRVARKRGSK